MLADENQLDQAVLGRIQAANSTIKTHIIASLALGLVPVPVFDIAALAATQMNMLRSLSEIYAVPFDDADVKPIVTALVGGSLPVLGVLGLSSLVKVIPGIGTLAGGASVAVTAGALAYAFGQVFVMHFESGGTFENFEAKSARAFFAREFEAGKAFVEEVKKEFKEADADTAAQSAEGHKPTKKKE